MNWDIVVKVPCLSAQLTTSCDHSGVRTSDLTITDQSPITTEPCAYESRNPKLIESFKKKYWLFKWHYSGNMSCLFWTPGIHVKSTFSITWIAVFECIVVQKCRSMIMWKRIKKKDCWYLTPSAFNHRLCISNLYWHSDHRK